MSTFDVTELEEMTPSKWDGKSRDMLVWNDSDIHELATRPVIGFIDGHWITLHGWYDTWDHCAEIPKEMALTESLLEIARLQGEILKLKDEKEQLNLVLNLLQKDNKQNDSDTTDTDTNVNIREYQRMAYDMELLFINGHSYYQYDDVDNLCTKFIKAMKKLIEENNRLKSEKHDMESPLNTCDNECGNSLVTGTIDESNEVLHTCIADPKSCHCNNSTRKYRRMTHRELAEWLAKGNGQYRFSSALEAKLEAKFEYIYYCDNDDATVQDNISIRAWNEQIWHEPVIEE